MDPNTSITILQTYRYRNIIHEVYRAKVKALVALKTLVRLDTLGRQYSLNLTYVFSKFDTTIKALIHRE